MKLIEISPIKLHEEDFEDIEKIITKLFRDEIYIPLLKELGIKNKVLKNSREDLIEAITSGRIAYVDGKFTGQFNSQVSGEIRRLGGVWDRRQGCFKVPRSKVPVEVKNAIAISQSRFEGVLKKISQRLVDMVPENIADKLDLSKKFDTALFRTKRRIDATLKGISVAPDLTDKQSAKIAEDYTNNMQKYIKDWTEKEIKTLRKEVQKQTLAGTRYEELSKTIQDRYGVSQSKAKFLARQETNLFLTKFKENRYQDAGVKEYIWTCSAGSAQHPVRPTHKRLNGKIFFWNSPPITDDNGSRNNPGEDYNCRCFARPIVRFNK